MPLAYIVLFTSSNTMPTGMFGRHSIGSQFNNCAAISITLQTAATQSRLLKLLGRASNILPALVYSTGSTVERKKFSCNESYSALNQD